MAIFTVFTQGVIPIPPRRWNAIGTLGVCFVFFFLGLLSKESAIVGLPIIFLLLWLVLEKRKKASVWLVGSTLTFLFYLFWRVFLAKIPILGHSSIVPIASASFKERILTIPFEIFSYIRLIFFPKDLFISQHQVVREVGDVRFWGTLPVVIIFFGLLVKLIKSFRSRLGWFFFLWFLISLSLVLNLFPLDMTIAERWLYFPILGMLGMLGLRLADTEPLRLKKKIWILGVVVALLSVRTFRRTFDWRNGLTLFGHDIKLNSEAFDLQNNYGTELFRRGRLEEAKPHFEKSIELAPNWWTSYNNLGVVSQRKGDFKKAKELYHQAIENGDYYLAYENLAGLMLETDEPQQTIKFVISALEKLPLNQNLRTILVISYARKGNYDQAFLEAQKLYQISPTFLPRQLLEAIIKKERI